MRPESIRRLALAAGATAVAAAAAVATTPAAFAAGTAVTGGHSSLHVVSPEQTAFANAKVTISAVSPATYKSHTVRLPITGGTATPPTYVIHYGGAFKFTKGSNTVTVHGIIENTNTNRVTALFNNHSRFDLFKLVEPYGGSGGPGYSSWGYHVTFTGPAQTYLDNHLNTKVFANHPKFGTDLTDVTFK